MDKHLFLGCVFFLIHVFQVQSRTFTEEDCPGKINMPRIINYCKYYVNKFILMFTVCVATIDKFSKSLEGETKPKNIEEQFRKYCLSTKNDKEKRLVSKLHLFLKLELGGTYIIQFLI